MTPPLDPGQRRVVELPDDADAIVLGGTGTGKTTVAVETVADRVLERGWEPGSVLAIAASRRSAALLRDRIAARLGVPTPGPMARTPASLAHSIVAADAVRRDAPPPVYVSGADHDRLIAAIVDEEIAEDADEYWGRAGLGRDVRGLAAFRGEVRDLIARAAERGIGARRLAALGEERGRPEWSVVAAFIPKLAARLEDEHQGFTPLDSGYVLREAADLVLADAADIPALRLVVVDDAQELVLGAQRLLAAFAGRGTRIIAIGDPDLATLTFRGAMPAGFAAPDGLWAGVGREPGRLALTTAWRHGAKVRAAVGRVLSGMAEPVNGVPGRRQVVAPDPDGSVEAVLVPGSHEQAAYVARRLRERHARDGVPFASMAVVSRTAGSAARLAHELRGMHVPTEAGGETTRGRSDYATRGLLLTVAVAAGVVELDADVAEELLASCLGRLDPVGLRRLRMGLRTEALKVGRDESGRDLLVEAMRLPAAFDVLDFGPSRVARRVAETVGAVRARLADAASIEEALWEAWSRSGLAKEWGDAARGAGIDADLANEQLDEVLALFDAAKRFVERTPEARVETFLSRRLGARLVDDSLVRRAVGDAVVVGTPSSLLGREFDTVVVIDLEEGVWPNLRPRGSLLRVGELAEGAPPPVTATERRKEVLDDELRMLAAAVGKAARRVIAVGIRSGDTSPSPLLRRIAPRLEQVDEATGETRIEPVVDEVDPDRLEPLTLRGLTARLRRELTRSVGEDGERAPSRPAAAGLARLASAGVPGAHPAAWYGLLDVTTSAPLKEPEEDVHVSPSKLGAFETCQLHWVIEHLGGGSGSFAASVGTIVHAVAEHIEDETVDEILPGIEHALAALPYESEWEAAADRVRAAEYAARLVAYQRQLRADGGVTAGREVPFEVRIGRAVLKGKVDRVERMGDGSAVVVDFKTGKESSYTSDGSVAGHPQLAAYQVALEAGALLGGLEGFTAAIENGGARLVVLGREPKKSSGGVDAPRQAPLAAEEVAGWHERILRAADGMAGATFVASIASHCTDKYSYGPCSIHIVEAVSE